MKLFTIKKLLQYYLPVTLSLFTWVTIERTVTTDGGYDRLYGLPLAYISNGFAFSMHYSVFILAMLFNLTILFGLTILSFRLLEKMKIILKTHWTLITVGVIVSVFWICILILTTLDSSFQLKSDTDYITTSKKITFGVRP